MSAQTEKALYEHDVNDALRDVKANVILWGEDLYDASIVVYPKQLSDAIPDSYQWQYLKKAILVYFDFKSENFVRFTGVRWDEENRVVYLAAGNFEGLWKLLKSSVKKGFLNNPDKVAPSARPTDIVDLECMCTDTNVAYIKEDRIAYKSREIPAEKLKLMGKKQSALDNPRNWFFYSSEGGFFHIKDCETVKTIKPEVFRGSPDIPEGYMPCYRCRRKIFLRVACDPYVKQINRIDRMLKKYEIRDSKLEMYALTYGFKFRLGDEGELYVTGAEDTWLIKGLDEGKFYLWHNNYVRTGPRERTFTSGFHDQEVASRNLNFILEFIHDYSFERHLEEEEEKLRKKSAGADAAGAQTVAAGTGEQTGKKSVFSRVVAFFKRIFRKS